MKIKFHKKFEKQFSMLPSEIKQKAKKVIVTFTNNPKTPSLKNHQLTGRMKDLRALSVTGKIRIIFQEFDDYTLIIFLSIGGHEEVYK